MKPLGEPQFNIWFLILIMLELYVLQIIIGKFEWLSQLAKWEKRKRKEKTENKSMPSLFS